MNRWVDKCLPLMVACVALGTWARPALPPGGVPPKPWRIINEDNDRYYLAAGKDGAGILFVKDQPPRSIKGGDLAAELVAEIRRMVDER
jgi:hypothetical protein